MLSRDLAQPAAISLSIFPVHQYDRVVGLILGIGASLRVPIVGAGAFFIRVRNRVLGIGHQEAGVLGIGDKTAAYPVILKFALAAGFFVLVGFGIIRQAAHPERASRNENSRRHVRRWWSGQIVLAQFVERYAHCGQGQRIQSADNLRTFRSARLGIAIYPG
jgi:hypothetical protein